MSLQWTMDPDQQLVLATGTGEVTHADVDAFLTDILRRNALSWRRLIDLREARIALAAEEVMALGVRIRAANSSGDIGALALVVPRTDPENVMRLAGFLAAAQRPMRIFKAAAPARRWIDRQRPDKPAL